MTTAIEFLRRLAKEGGRIVSTAELTVMQIEDARLNRRIFVDEETGLGFVLLPWEFRTNK